MDIYRVTKTKRPLTTDCVRDFSVHCGPLSLWFRLNIGWVKTEGKVSFD